MIVKLPGTMSNKGAMSNEFVHVRDIVPTILDISDVAHTRDFEGRSVLDISCDLSDAVE